MPETAKTQVRSCRAQQLNGQRERSRVTRCCVNARSRALETEKNIGVQADRSTS